MDRKGIRQALENGDFDGISYVYKPYDGYGKTSFQRSMKVVGSVIEWTLTAFGKVFNGKENERYADSKTELLEGDSALDFIESHSYSFQKKRPDLF